LERRSLILNIKTNDKKILSQKNETLSLVTPPNETYNGKEIPHTLLTTAGEFVQYDQSLKISNLEGLPESKTPEFKYLNQFHKESTERKLKKIEEWSKSPLPLETVIEQIKKNSKDY
jgi:hypothetical protein